MTIQLRVRWLNKKNRLNLFYKSNDCFADTVMHGEDEKNIVMKVITFMIILSDKNDSTVVSYPLTHRTSSTILLAECVNEIWWSRTMVIKYQKMPPHIFLALIPKSTHSTHVSLFQWKLGSKVTQCSFCGDWKRLYRQLQTGAD